jgi:uncharacterized membrane protein
MPDDAKSKLSPLRTAGRYIFIGLVTAAPLAITWWIVSFLFNQLSELGTPWVWGVSQGIRPRYPKLADFMLNETVQSVAAVLIVLAFLYVLGWATGRVIGQRLIGMFESVIGAIPFVDSIYRATKRFLAVAGRNETGERRVVLIDFPSPEMKAIGLVTRILRDSDTGEELAAVYVPTSPNPTSGYIEIVPLRSVVFTDWTFDQAMSFVVTGGSNAPETIAYSTKGREKDPADPPAKAG